MKKYEKETGKKAIWRGTVTESFKKWQKGEKVYPKEKERINLLVAKEKKDKWQHFANNNDFPTVSKLIREAVDQYIETKSDLSKFENLRSLIHKFKENLNAIKAFSQLLIKEYKNELPWEILLKIKENIQDKSINIESLLNELENEQNFDIAIIEDDESTYTILKEFFEKQGFKCQNFAIGKNAVNSIIRNKPKLILLDILLPDQEGYEVCKTIKSIDKTREIPIYYISAVPEIEIVNKMDETKADGYILKPFNIEDFDKLIEKIS